MTQPKQLAFCIESTPAGNARRHKILAKAYRGLSPADQLICRVEQHEIRRAKAGRYLATIAKGNENDDIAV